MALSIHRLVKFSNICVNGVRSGRFLKAECISSRHNIRMVSDESSARETRDPAHYFFQRDVQTLMDTIAGDDYDKIFRVRKLGSSAIQPRYKFLTDEELKTEMDSLVQKRKKLLQFPPVLLPRKEIDYVISKDPKLQGLDESKIIFTDITYGRDDSNRMIVARDPDGTLRKATWDERHRMNCIYFPFGGKDLEIPRLFQPENIASILNRKEYEFVLDKACVQFEPNDPLYIEVTGKVYDHVNINGNFEILYSTRHYGSLAFYLAFNGDIDGILEHSIAMRRISGAASLIVLYCMMHPGSQRAWEVDSDATPETIIEEYIRRSPSSDSLKDKWRTYVNFKNSENM